MRNQRVSASHKVALYITYIVLFIVSNSHAQNVPAWMDYMVRDEITDPGYIESQIVLDPYSISTIHVAMAPGDYSKLINETNNNEYLLADMTYESPNVPLQMIEQVGIRLRGAAARISEKKSFKISFRAFDYDDRDFFGLRKLNLNCDFQDPHLMRAKVCTDLFRLMGVDAARVGYSKLYINGDYRGLFANYEDLDKAFLKTRFVDNNGDLYKCDGASMADYSGYWLTTNEETSDHSDINEFINVLNNTPADRFKEEIEKVFDVNEMLMSTACNVLLGAWDDYWVLQKNYYLYHDVITDQFKHIPHDFDGSLGTYWYSKNMDVAHQNVYNWSPTPNRSTPMISKLLAVPEYRNRYTHYMMLLCMYPFSLGAMEPEIDRTADMIRETLINDPYWDWHPSDFDNAFNQAVSNGNVDYGMKEYIDLRRNSAWQQLESIGPFIKQMNRYPLLPTETDPVTISQLVVDKEYISGVKLVYKVGSSSEEIEMFDNGIGADTEADDFIYSAQVPAQGNADLVLYYVEATNSLGKTSRYPAADEWASYDINYEPPLIQINEVLASNDSTNHDNAEEYDDWFELYNPGDEIVDLTGMYVSDNLSNPRKWKLGNMTIPAKGFILLWADNDPEQGSDHVGFKLSGSGEELGLFDTDENQNVQIDKMQFGPQTIDVSYGRTQDGADEWIFFEEPTPGWGNRDTIPVIDEMEDITDFGGEVAEPNNDSPNGEEIDKIIDNDISTKYLTFKSNTWITYTLPYPTRANGYAIVSANDYPGRDPSNWEFQGFDEDTEKWVTLHMVANEPQWPNRFYSKEFLFSNNQSFKSYRLNIHSSNGGGIIQIAELEIYQITPTQVDMNEKPVFPIEFSLEQNYPNPFNPNTFIRYQLTALSYVDLSIYNLLGQKVATLVSGEQPAGAYKVLFNGNNLASGIYYYKITTAELTQVRRMLLMK